MGGGYDEMSVKVDCAALSAPLRHRIPAAARRWAALPPDGRGGLGAAVASEVGGVTACAAPTVDYEPEPFKPIVRVGLIAGADPFSGPDAQGGFVAGIEAVVGYHGADGGWNTVRVVDTSFWLEPGG